MSAHRILGLKQVPRVGRSIWTCSKPDVQDRFVDTLRRAGITTTVRDTRGSDIDGACGQLAAEALNQETARRIR